MSLNVSTVPREIQLITAWAVAVVLSGISPCLAQIGPGARPPVPTDPLPPKRAPSGIEIKPFAQPLPDSDRMGRVNVTRFRFTGLSSQEDSELQQVVSRWIGRELTAPDLSQLLKAVTDHLRSRGLYAAQAYLPDQEVKDGVVEIAVLEGRLGAVKIETDGGARLARRTVEGFLSSLQSGAPISRGVFDTPLLLLNDLPGVRLVSHLSPGNAPGTADLEVRAADEPLAAGSLRLDNYEIPEVGRYGATASLRLRNPTGIGDLATGEFRTTHTGDLTRATLSYSVPVNRAGSRVGLILGEQRYALKGIFEPLQANGDYSRITLGATHPFVRTNNSNLSGDLTLNQSIFRDRIDIVDFEQSARHRYATLRLRADRTDAVFGGGRTEAYIEVQKGRIELDAAEAAFDALTLQVNGGFTRWRAGVQRAQALSGESEIVASIFGQLASKNLAAGREFELGGPNGVRAYPVDEMYPDEGYLARVNLNQRLFSRDGWRAVGGVFWDAGRGTINKNPLPGTIGNTRTLSGAGLQFGMAHRQNFDLGLSMAWRTAARPVFGADRNPRAWLWTTAYF